MAVGTAVGTTTITGVGVAVGGGAVGTEVGVGTSPTHVTTTVFDVADVPFLYETVNLNQLDSGRCDEILSTDALETAK